MPKQEQQQHNQTPVSLPSVVFVDQVIRVCETNTSVFDGALEHLRWVEPC